MAGQKECGIRQTGQIKLEDGRIAFYDDEGRRIGQMIIGVDGLYFDGLEPTFCQKDDPPKIRLAARGANAGGEISFNRMRDNEDKQEELVRFSGTQADGAGSENVGQCIVSVRDRGENDANGDYRWRRVFVATSAYLGGMWSGLLNYVGNMGPFADGGSAPAPDVPVPSAPPVPASNPGELWSADRKYLAVRQGDGNFVMYRANDNGGLMPVWDRWSHEARG